MLAQKRTEEERFSQSAVPKGKQTGLNQPWICHYAGHNPPTHPLPSCATNAVLQINIPIALGYNVLMAEREKGGGFGDA